jgi:hypothetical protein
VVVKRRGYTWPALPGECIFNYFEELAKDGFSKVRKGEAIPESDIAATRVPGGLAFFARDFGSPSLCPMTIYLAVPAAEESISLYLKNSGETPMGFPNVLLPATGEEARFLSGQAPVPFETVAGKKTGGPVNFIVPYQQEVFPFYSVPNPLAGVFSSRCLSVETQLQKDAPAELIPYAKIFLSFALAGIEDYTGNCTLVKKMKAAPFGADILKVNQGQGILLPDGSVKKAPVLPNTLLLPYWSCLDTEHSPKFYRRQGDYVWVYCTGGEVKTLYNIAEAGTVFGTRISRDYLSYFADQLKRNPDFQRP